ncbi:hypothetical protein Vretimale_18140 [Volvox reticuliferus]|uniref:Uncharacterized protein n=1 Tax=Volvox reticuliferus TaxID=1737510 RepID=A0A8J4GW64_9CHLO|nr:hypothetical protein Vretifemale_17781 [Volvox reticuliferus]GIM15227.1 hypothetical protein Vretimale_18140 [Volvox reticuliferus]
MKRKDIWKELDLPPPPKKALALPRSMLDKERQEAAQQALRLNCTKTIQLALSTPPPPDKLQPPGVEEDETGDAASKAEAIERELYMHHKSIAGQDYKTTARTLVASLKRNSELRRRVLMGAVSPTQLVSMDIRELATQQQREEYARLQERETRRVTLAGHGSTAAAAATPPEYRCERCGGRTCDYLDSGRRDIGKCETWGSKDGQGASRLVTCLGCGHRWEVDDV